MEWIYPAFVFVLFLMAFGDLIVGVSNDAVNFLNSAIGSKVAPRRFIMIVASIGIILGATFSDGLMEVARKGIFNPGMFTFADVMVLFVAVMVTDVILLDTFNSLGLPTSTTVSIVFELLGASVALAAFKMIQGGLALSGVYAFVNVQSAVTIISGIFLSVGIAFLVGGIVQLFSRLLFTFEYENRLKSVGVIWSAVALTALLFFLVLKGLSGASFIPDGVSDRVLDNIGIISIILLVGLTVLMATLQRLGQHPLRIVVLFGTFSLAFAFAGNDLVNFIGVPLAGLASFQLWSGSGMDPEAMMMDGLAAPVDTAPWMLILAGLIMAVTLWNSKKAQGVTRTEIELARQGAGYERFKPGFLARGIVTTGEGILRFSAVLIPSGYRETFRGRLLPPPDLHDPDRPAFDLVRASVNLATASALIALATSMKLPLSTTYVTFMVAMGTSLADGAWGREHVHYRVSGVLSVIGGWLITAVAAFLVSGLMAIMISLLGVPGLVLAVIAAAVAVWMGMKRHARIEAGRAE